MSPTTPWRTVRGNKILALSRGHDDWYKIVFNKNVDRRAKVYIYDEIGFLGVTASDFIKDLAPVNVPLDIHLNSPGGEVNDGLTIYNHLLSRSDVDVYIDGIAASIASVIALAGSKVYIADSAQMMIHNPFTMAVGGAKDLRELADQLDENCENISKIYAHHAGRDPQYWKDQMEATTWYRGQEAVDAGLAHGLIAANRASHIPEMTARFDLGGVYAMAPPREAVQDAAAHPYHGSTEPMHEPMTGQHSHNHAAFGHPGHDDGIHHHAHSHSGDATHEHPHITHSHGHSNDDAHYHAHDAGTDHFATSDHEHTHHAGADDDHDGDESGTAMNFATGGVIHNQVDLPDEIRMHVDLHNASYDSSAWDGGAAMSAAVNSSNPASSLAAICAGRRSGPADERGSYALPHHKRPGSPPNRNGVNNALARLSSTEGLTNKSAAEAHLKAHQKAWASESGSSDDHDHTTIFDDLDFGEVSETLKGAIL